MPVTPLRPSDPAQVGPHRLLARLGQGGMGTVYLGISPDDRAVAVKVLRDGLVDPDARRRFRHELAALRRVRGPHLVEVLDADVDADTPYLATRFVPGTRLDDLVVRGGPLDETQLHSIARGLADALSSLHAAGVVHRDLTPGNVLVLDGQPHVIDLGLATAADVTAFTRSGLVIGTPGYLAPEQVTGSTVGPEVDVHAWGATVALAGTGRPPYGTGRPEAVLYRIVHGEPDLEGLPEPLATLVAAAMHPDPARRPASRELLAALGGTTGAAPVTVHLPSDVDGTTVLATPALTTPGRTTPAPAPPADALETTVIAASALASVRELAGATSGPRSTLPLPTAPSLSPTAAAPSAPPPPAPSPPDDARWESGAGAGTAPPPGPRSYHRYDGHDPRHDDRYGSDGDFPDALPDDLDDGHLEHAWPAEPAVRRPARDLQAVLTAAAAVAVVGATTLVAPVVGGAAALALLVGLRATGRASERLRTRRERRGGRRRDPVVAALASPWHLLLAALDTVVSLPLLAVAAVVPAGLVWLASPTVSGLERPELTAATGVVAALLAGLGRRVHTPSRHLLRRALETLTPGASSSAAVLAALVATALLLLAAAEGAAPLWWPVQPPT